MNRVVAFILAVLYLVFSAGITLDLHYCMGKIAAVKIETPSGKDTHLTCSVKPKKDCCKDELKVLKINDAHKTVASDYHFRVPVEQISQATFYSSFFSETLQAAIANKANAPPLLSSPNIFLKNCVFRI